MRGRTAALAWVLGVLAVMLAVLAALLFVRTERAAESAGQAARDEVTRVASEVAVELLTYTPDTVAADQYAAARRLTGEFRDRYGNFTDGVVVPSARAERITSSAVVTASGVSEMDGDEASALVFLTQTTSREGGGEPVATSVGARVDLVRVDGQWLVSEFETS